MYERVRKITPGDIDATARLADLLEAAQKWSSLPELFMGIGRARPKSLLRDGVVSAMLRPELRLLSARLFTMWRL